MATQLNLDTLLAAHPDTGASVAVPSASYVGDPARGLDAEASTSVKESSSESAWKFRRRT